MPLVPTPEMSHIGDPDASPQSPWLRTSASTDRLLHHGYQVLVTLGSTRLGRHAVTQFDHLIKGAAGRNAATGRGLWSGQLELRWMQCRGR